MKRKQVESLQKETARIEVLTARLCALEQRADRTRPERLTAAMKRAEETATPRRPFALTYTGEP
jgi:hypothetical protein